jgi:ribulose 1,5-bisphosphate carboxylase large subunit-like protein
MLQKEGRSDAEVVAKLHRLTGLDHLVTEFGYGAMPHEQAELNMRLFADGVVPVLQCDAAFAGPPASASDGAGGPAVPGASDIFAPV